MTPQRDSAAHELERNDETARTLSFVYTNYRGETGHRRVIPKKVWFGATEWHPVQQWLLEAFDLDVQEIRNFAVRDIKQFE
jgi:predicted DNA-binding transcriptional regulator YafY